MAKSIRPDTGHAPIDPVTGAIWLDDFATFLRPATTVDAFLASPLGRAAKPVMGNDHILYFALPACRIGGRPFGVSLIFDAQRQTLDTLLLELCDRAREPAPQNAAHKRWLRKQLPGIRVRASGERRFPWGTIEARWVPQNDESMIVVSYGDPT
jgi:hypothetical protein